MSLIKYAALPTARMSIFYLASYYNDLAIVDFSTSGHGLYNYGHLTRLEPLPAKNIDQRIFSTHLMEVDIALGDTTRLVKAVEEAVNSGYNNILLLPSSISAVLGFDLEGYAVELSTKFDVNVFTIKTSLNDDFYKGREAFLDSMTRFCNDKNRIKSSTYNLLGGNPSYIARQNHKNIETLIKDRLNMECNFDNLNASSVYDWNLAGTAKLNIVTSKCAINTAEFLKKTYGTPYIIACGLGKFAEDSLITEFASFFELTCDVKNDNVYEFVMFQMRNILAMNRPKIVCYVDIDKITSIKTLFEELGVQAEYYCSHKNDDYKYILPDDFIETYASQDIVAVSYDRICRQFSRAVEIDQIGLDYHLLTPLDKSDFGVSSAYEFVEKLSNLFV